MFARFQCFLQILSSDLIDIRFVSLVASCLLFHLLFELSILNEVADVPEILEVKIASEHLHNLLLLILLGSRKVFKSVQRASILAVSDFKAEKSIGIDNFKLRFFMNGFIFLMVLSLIYNFGSK